MKPTIYQIEEYCELSNDELRTMRDEDGDILAKAQLQQRANFYRFPCYNKVSIDQNAALEIFKD